MKATLVVVFLTIIACVSSKTILTPPVFDLAKISKVQASSTCGDQGSQEKYCSFPMTLTSTETIESHCNFCAINNRPSAENMVDGNEKTAWLSPPLSRGLGYQKVNLTFDLGQKFRVGYFHIVMENSSRPAVWVLERSKDFGRRYKPLMYFARNSSECQQYFGSKVRCEMSFSKTIPLNNGEIYVRLIDRKYRNISNMPSATNIRIRLLAPSILSGHSEAVLKGDTERTKYYFYSIKTVEIGGRCSCNGHGDNCILGQGRQWICECKHNTTGTNCKSCVSGYRANQNGDCEVIP